MVAHINTVALIGIEAKAVEVQVSLSSGLPAFTVVGLPDKAVGESRASTASTSQLSSGMPSSAGGRTTNRASDGRARPSKGECRKPQLTPNLWTGKRAWFHSFLVEDRTALERFLRASFVFM